MSAPRVLAVVVHWRNVDDTAACLRSLVAAAYPALEVALVDNGSAESDALAALAGERGVRLLASASNRGFAGGANLGLRVALDEGFAYALLVNNDAVVAPEMLSRLVATAEADPTIGAVGPKVLDAADPARIWYLGGRWGGWFAVALGEGARDGPRWAAIWAVDFVSGCGMLLRCAALRRVGLFDERYFMYYEDADLCRRLAAAGYRVVADGRARMWHAVARSTAHDPPWRRYLRDRSRALFQLGAVAPWQRAPMAALLALAWGRQAARDLQAGHGAAAWASARGLWAGVRDAWAGMLTSPPVPRLTGVGMAARRPLVGGSPFPPPDAGAPEGRFSRSFALPAAPFREGEAPAEPSPSPSNAQSVPTCPCKPSPSRRTETGT